MTMTLQPKLQNMTWSPDGKYIACTITDRGFDYVHIIDVAKKTSKKTKFEFAVSAKVMELSH